METKHTKGEWEKRTTSTGYKIIAVGKPIKMFTQENLGAFKKAPDHTPEDLVCDIDYISPEAEANAKLIAQSPALLKENEYNLNAFTKIIGMIPEGDDYDAGNIIEQIRNTVFARFKTTKESIKKATI